MDWTLDSWLVQKYMCAAFVTIPRSIRAIEQTHTETHRTKASSMPNLRKAVSQERRPSNAYDNSSQK
ncbi:hypothetical protein CEXT_192931 [Caerostris extrusa]|uniref:Uncharacterized protein n=1 Tax=Caerostris extrusa TaxID=172846 RepID=A0AAV4R620_CAEEX|nr:hypothetical protein CEXT_192931 [Caerostris extrusa]